MTRPKPLQPTEREGSHGSTIFEHPAFGLIGGSRVSGSTVLFGSDFEHHNFVEIRISRAGLHRGLSHDWHFGRQEVASVRLSEAQWATFVSSLNNGQGVPCTLAYVGTEAMPSIPLRREEDTARAEARSHLAEMVELVDKAINEVVAGVGSGLSKTKRDAVLAPLHKLRMEIGANTSFMMDSFERHFETTVESAKVEIEAHMQNAIRRAGLAALTGGDTPLVSLPPAHDTPENEP